MITREADYSIRAILYLASKWPDGYPIPASALAEEMNIPYRFLRRIVRRLAEAGFVVSERGRAGGIHLAKAPEKINLHSLLSAIDPKSICLNLCLEHQSPDCPRKPECSVHKKLDSLQATIDAKLTGIDFRQLTS